VMKWMCDRIEGKVDAQETPIGLLPRQDDLDLQGLSIPHEDLGALLHVDIEAWRAEIPDIRRHFAQFGERLPQRMSRQVDALAERLAR